MTALQLAEESLALLKRALEYATAHNRPASERLILLQKVAAAQHLVDALKAS